MKKYKEHDAKIKLVYRDFDGNIAIESVRASKEGAYYRIKNVPFFAPNISYNDLVRVENDDGELYFDEIIEASGHSTIQIIIYDLRNMEQITKHLTTFGCDWEGSHLKGYISVDIPAKIGYQPIREYLTKMTSRKILDFKEASLAHSY